MNVKDKLKDLNDKKTQLDEQIKMLVKQYNEQNEALNKMKQVIQNQGIELKVITGQIDVLTELED